MSVSFYWFLSSTHRIMPKLFVVLLALVLLASCDSGTSSDDPDPDAELGTYALEEAFPRLTFERPVDLQHAGDGTGRLFVVEQRGRIRVFDPASAEVAPVFLDLQNVVSRGGNEEGLLGLAFHPDYEMNGAFFVNYTAPDPLRTVVARYQVDGSDPDRADAASGEVLLEIAQPYSNHNAGQLAFGPDGYLYIATGDGGSGGDPGENAEDLSSLLGKMLRIDVDAPLGGRAYGVPTDNPFVAADCGPAGCRDEIYAYGLRNPWRFSFDHDTGRLWAADVGQSAWEEIDLIEAGGNYGWDVMEGAHCFEPREDCDRDGLVLPVWEYNHFQDGQSITGGYVYRGPSHPGLVGRYVYADFVTGRIWALAYDGQEATNDLLLDTGLQIASFGQDADRELYILAFDGLIYRLARA